MISRASPEMRETNVNSDMTEAARNRFMANADRLRGGG